MKTLYRILIAIAVALIILVTVLFVRNVDEFSEERCEERFEYNSTSEPIDTLINSTMIINLTSPIDIVAKPQIDSMSTVLSYGAEY